MRVCPAVFITARYLAAWVPPGRFRRSSVGPSGFATDPGVGGHVTPAGWHPGSGLMPPDPPSDHGTHDSDGGESTLLAACAGIGRAELRCINMQTSRLNGEPILRGFPW